MAVQHCNCILHVSKTALETLDCLRRERNLRDENNCGAPVIERGPDRLQINFRFSRAGHAVEQNRARILGRIECLRDFLRRVRLLLVQNQVRRCNELLVCVRIANHSFLAQLREAAFDQRTKRLVVESDLA